MRPAADHGETEDGEADDGAADDGAVRPGSDRPVSLATALRIPGVLAILLAFLAYCGLESTTILWASTYLVQARDVAVATAAAFAALFLLGITAC